MAFKGSLDTMPLPDILQWLADSQKTGTLIVTHKSEKKEIYLKNGVIISASSNLDKDRFGVLLVKEGIVSQEKLLKLLQEGKEKGKLLGKLCVEKGLLSEAETRSMLQRQAEQIIESLFHRKEGEFIFKEGELPDKDLVQISVIMHQLFFDSAAKRKHWRRIHDILGRMDTILKTAPDPPGNIQSLTDLEKQLISSVSQRGMSVMDICARIEKKDFEICMALADLVEKKWLVKIEDKQQDDDQLQDKLWHASILLEQRRYLQAVQLLEKLKQQFPENKKVLSLLERSSALLEEDIKLILKNENKKPVLVKGFNKTKLQSLNFSPQEWFVFSRINGKTTLRELYYISGLGKSGTQRVLYALINIGAVLLKQDTASTTSRFKINPEQLQKQASMKQQNAFKTGEFTIPKEFLSKKEDQKTKIHDEKEKKELLDVNKLNQIYSQYLNMNHYEILGVSQNASPAEIREAFVKLSKQYHPDMHFENLQPAVQERLEELFSIVNHSYRVLSSPSSRKRYDEELWADRKIKAKTFQSLTSLNEFSSPSIDIKLKKDTKKKEKIHIDKPKPSKKKPESTSSAQSPSKLSSTQKFTDQDKTVSRKPQKKDWTFYLDEGKDFLEKKQYKKAINSLEKSLRMNPKNAETYYTLSIAQEKIGGPTLKQAEENIKRALILDRENAVYYCQLSRIHLSRDNFVEAERYAKTALAWNSHLKQAKKLLEEIKNKQKGTGIFKALKLGLKKKKK